MSERKIHLERHDWWTKYTMCGQWIGPVRTDGVVGVYVGQIEDATCLHCLIAEQARLQELIVESQENLYLVMQKLG